MSKHDWDKLLDDVLWADYELNDDGEPLRMPNDLNAFYSDYWAHTECNDAESAAFQRRIFAAMFPGHEKMSFSGRVLDVGCGSGVAARAFFRDFSQISYTGVDSSDSIAQAGKEFLAAGLSGKFIKALIENLPFPAESFDIVFCVGVLHYLDYPKEAVRALHRVLRRGGLLIVWLYKEPPPARQLSDSFLRAILNGKSPAESSTLLESLTRLGMLLGQSTATVSVSEGDPLAPAGTYALQRFIYYYVMKLFYSSDLSFERHLMQNLNSFYPQNVRMMPITEIAEMFAPYERVLWNEQGNGVAAILRKSEDTPR